MPYSEADFINTPNSTEQITKAFQEKYGMAAPGNILAELTHDYPGQVTDTGLYRRILRGDWDTEFRQRYPDYLQQSGVAQMARQQLGLRKEANAPIAASMKTQRTSLDDRYKAILDELKFSEGKETDAITKERSAEFGRRGISLSSGAYSQALNQATQPVSQNYSVQRALALVQKQQEQDQLEKAIAELEAGQPDVAIPAGNALAPGFTEQNVKIPQALDYERSGLIPSGYTSKETAKQSFADQAKSLAELIKQFRG